MTRIASTQGDLCVAEAPLNTRYGGEFPRVYRTDIDDHEHLVLLNGDVRRERFADAAVRVDVRVRDRGPARRRVVTHRSVRCRTETP